MEVETSVGRSEDTLAGEEGTTVPTGREASEMLTTMEESSTSMEETTSEGMGNGKAVGLKVGTGRAVMFPDSLGTVAFGAPGKDGVVPLDTGNGRMVSNGGNGREVSLEPGRVAFWSGMVGKPPPKEELPAPGKEMGKVVTLVPPRKLERISEKGPEIPEKMEEKSNPPGLVPLAGEKPRPKKKGGCPDTPVRLTLLPGPARPLKAEGMSCWKIALKGLLPPSPKP